VKAPTLYDVAKAAGVSHQTVSRFVKGQTNIRPELRERVERAVNELGYQPNLSARALATSRSHRIGALVYEIVEVGPNKIMQGASTRAREAGYILDLVSLDPNDDHAIEQAIGLINQADLAGLMVFAPTARVIAALEKVNFTVPVYVETDEATRPSGEADWNGIGAELLIEHLASLGHRRFFHVQGPADWFAAEVRGEGYRRAVARRGLVSVGESVGGWSAASGYAAAMAMPLDAGITAVIAANDQTALGVIAALSERGVRVPDEVSVVGFDDIPEARYYRPALTSVHLDFEAQGRTAMDRMFRMLPFGPAVEESIPTPPRLVVRESTAPPRR
jgi:LacI family transcriptional regulator